MTTASRQWTARGGPILLGTLIPGGFVCIGLACLAGSIANVRGQRVEQCWGISVLGRTCAACGLRGLADLPNDLVGLAH